jgi:hypothetical protein
VTRRGWDSEFCVGSSLKEWLQPVCAKESVSRSSVLRKEFNEWKNEYFQVDKTRFLRSTNVKFQRQIKENSVNNCDFFEECLFMSVWV